MKNLTLLLLFLAGCVAPPARDDHAPKYTYTVRVTNFYGASGRSVVHSVTSTAGGTTLCIAKFSTMTGHTRLDYRGEYDRNAVDALGSFLATSKFADLQRSYVNPHAFDGYQLDVEIEMPLQGAATSGSTNRLFHISNVYHPWFIELSEKVNRAFPEEHQMPIPPPDYPLFKRKRSAERKHSG